MRQHRVSVVCVTLAATAALLLFASLPLSAVGPRRTEADWQAAAQARVPADLAPAIDAVDRMIATTFAGDKIASVTAGVVADGRLVWTHSYGDADMEKRVPATAETVYRIGSITKQFTALMLLQLVEQGTVHLSDPVEKYFPEINQVSGRPAGAPPITLVQLATMTSGLDREPADLDTYLKGPVAEWERVLISALPRTKYAYEPDTHFFYSNIGYAILGAALGRAAGQPYTEYVREHIFTPLGMTHTAFEPNAAIAPLLAKGYVIAPGRLDSETPAREHQGRGYKVPNGAVYTTVGDLARFVAFELGGDAPSVLKKATLEDNYARVNSSDGALRTGYGIGFQLIRFGDLIVYGHDGSVAGYTAGSLFERTSRTGVIVLRNATGGAVGTHEITVRAMGTIAAARRKPGS